MLFMTDLSFLGKHINVCSVTVLMITDAVESKLHRELPIRHKRNSPENICKVYFSNKAVELINLPFLLNNTQLVSLLSDLPCNFLTPTVNHCIQFTTTYKFFYIPLQNICVQP